MVNIFCQYMIELALFQEHIFVVKNGRMCFIFDISTTSLTCCEIQYEVMTVSLFLCHQTPLNDDVSRALRRQVFCLVWCVDFA